MAQSGTTSRKISAASRLVERDPALTGKCGQRFGIDETGPNVIPFDEPHISRHINGPAKICVANSFSAIEHGMALSKSIDAKVAAKT